jgi:hypothetical protein
MQESSLYAVEGYLRIIWENKKSGVQMSKQGHVQRSGDVVENGVQQGDMEQGRAYWEYKRRSKM